MQSESERSDIKSQHQPPLLIGLSGGPCAGKEQVCQLIMESLVQRHSLASAKVVMIKYILVNVNYGDIDCSFQALQDGRFLPARD